jgi:hypothetical protein
MSAENLVDIANEILQQHGLMVEFLPLLTDVEGWSLLRNELDLTMRQCLALRALVPPKPTAATTVVHEEFSMGPVGAMQNCLDFAPDVTVRQAVLGPGPCVFDLLPAIEPTSNYAVTREALMAVIETHRDWLISNSPIPFDKISLDLQLILRIYTAHFPFPLYQYVNRCLNSPDRSSRLAAVAPFAKLTISALRAAENIGMVKTAEAYRGMTVEGNPALSAKYDNYVSAFKVGLLTTFPAFTSVSTEAETADNFGNKIFFHFVNVSGIDVSCISCFPGEKELVITPPGVFRILGVFMVKSVLVITVGPVFQQSATYLSLAAQQTAIKLRNIFSVEALTEAVELWYTDKSVAELIHGNISVWRTVEVRGKPFT